MSAAGLRRIRLCLLERVKRIELSSLAWEATALPLSYTRLCFSYHLAGARLKQILGLSGHLAA